MRCLLIPLSFALLAVGWVLAYVEAPHTLGRIVHESTHIVHVEITKIDTERNLILYKKLKDLKGKHPQDVIKHNIGKAGFHPREWQTVMAWAAPGKQAIFFHNGGSSETCIGNYWYQCNPAGNEWWAMTHAEPFLLRSYTGSVEKLVDHVTRILKGETVVVSCFADVNKEQLHMRKGKLQQMRASLKLLDYNPKRDFVAWGGEDGQEEFKTVTVLPESAEGWKFMPATPDNLGGEAWKQVNFDDSKWRVGKAPIGYGEEEITKRKGTIIAEQGQPFVFRRTFDVPSDLLTQKGVTITLNIASDDSADVYINGELADKDPEADHEFSYWNRSIELPLKLLKPGKNHIAAYVRNKQGSSDLYLDVDISALIPLPKKIVVLKPNETSPKIEPRKPPAELKLPTDPMPSGIVVDVRKRTVTVPVTVAPRKLEHLNEIYPLEVVASRPHPHGKKAHETIVNFDGFKPSHVHRALMLMGLRPGKPARGEGTKATGPQVLLLLELPGGKRVPIESLLVNTRAGNKPIAPITWHFTGSVFTQPDPEKDEWIYGADATGTLGSLFPVTDETVFQSSLTMADEAKIKLELGFGALPKTGTALKLVIEAK